MHMDLAEFQRGFGYLIDLVYIHVCYNKVRLYNICVIHPQRLSFGVRRHFSSASVGSTRRKRYSSSFWFEFHSAMIVCCVNLTHYSGLFPVMCCSYGLAIDHKVMGLIPWCDHWILMKKEQKKHLRPNVLVQVKVCHVVRINPQPCTTTSRITPMGLSDVKPNQ